MNTNDAPIADRTLWDSLGNKCRIAMYPMDSDPFKCTTFELYMHPFNDAVPRRMVGGLGMLNNIADHWLAARKAEGFVEQFPGYNPGSCYDPRPN